MKKSIKSKIEKEIEKAIKKHYKLNLKVELVAGGKHGHYSTPIAFKIAELYKTK